MAQSILVKVCPHLLWLSDKLVKDGTLHVLEKTAYEQGMAQFYTSGRNSLGKLNIALKLRDFSVWTRCRTYLEGDTDPRTK